MRSRTPLGITPLRACIGFQVCGAYVINLYKKAARFRPKHLWEQDSGPVIARTSFREVQKPSMKMPSFQLGLEDQRGKESLPWNPYCLAPGRPPLGLLRGCEDSGGTGH